LALDSRESSELDMTEQYKAYVSGFFDGEGCVSMQAYYQKGKYEDNPRISMQLNLTQISVEVLEYVKKEFGGRIHLHSKPNSRHKDCYRWTVSGKKNMKFFLESIVDYSIVKKEEILLGLEFIETLRDENLGCKPLPEHIHVLRRDIYNKLIHRKPTVPTGSDSCEQTPNMLENPERAISRHRPFKAGKAPETTKEHLYEMVV
jgi:hypothetical protein